MSPEIKCFKLNKLPSDIRFTINRVKSLDAFDHRFKVNWEVESDYDLTVALNNQIFNEFLDRITMYCSYVVCKDGNNNDETIVKVNQEGQVVPVIPDMSVEQRRVLGEKFIRFGGDYMEIYSRDEDAFEQDKFNIELYAVVLLVDGVYQGHIYAWQSPVDKQYCFAMGIRNRIDTIFLKYTDQNVKNVSHYLVEGCRQLTLALGSSQCVIVYPKPIMQKILPQLGFERTNVRGSIIGNSINPFSLISWNNYTLKDMLKPIIDNNVKFSVV